MYERDTSMIVRTTLQWFLVAWIVFGGAVTFYRLVMGIGDPFLVGALVGLVPALISARMGYNDVKHMKKFSKGTTFSSGSPPPGTTEYHQWCEEQRHSNPFFPGYDGP